MRIFVFGIALSAAAVMASPSFAAWAVCSAGYKAEPRMINGSEEYGQSYTCTGSKVAEKLVCSSEFAPQGSSGPAVDNTSAMSRKDDEIVYTCAEPTTPSK